MANGASSALITATLRAGFGAAIVNKESTVTSASGEGERLHLYQGSTQQFIADATQARLANQLSDRFFDEFRYRPAPSEVTSWRNSLGAMASVLQLADLTDQGILVELKLPLSSKRLDVLITGSNPATGDSAVIVELKQWTEVGRSNITDCVTVDFGGRPRDHLHPSRQVAQYQRYLRAVQTLEADEFVRRG